MFWTPAFAGVTLQETFYETINVDSEITPEGNFDLPQDYSLFHVVESS